MYNEMLKIEFVSAYTQSQNTMKACSAVFGITERFETELQRDVCSFSADELRPVVELLGGPIHANKWRGVEILKSYGRFCINRGISYARNDITAVCSNNAQKIRKHYVSSPEHLQRYLDCVFDKESEMTVDIIHRCFFWLAFMGIEYDDAIRLESSRVNLDDMVVCCDGIDYDIYKQGYKAIKLSVGMKDFRYIHPNYPDKVVYKERCDGSLLLRAISDTTSNGGLRASTSVKCKKAVSLGKTDIQLSYKRALYSGLFYRAYENERMGIPPYFGDKVDRDMSGVEYKLDKSRSTLVSKRNQMISSYLEYYGEWKEAFSI